MIGVDIEEITRFKNKSDKFLEKIYTKQELEYCMQYSQAESHLAVRFCAKEAVIKTLTAFNITNIYFKDIEIYLNENSVPKIRILKPLDIELNFNVSLSHSKNNAIAFVTADLKC